MRSQICLGFCASGMRYAGFWGSVPTIWGLWAFSWVCVSGCIVSKVFGIWCVTPLSSLRICVWCVRCLKWLEILFRFWGLWDLGRFVSVFKVSDLLGGMHEVSKLFAGMFQKMWSVCYWGFVSQVIKSLYFRGGLYPRVWGLWSFWGFVASLWGTWLLEGSAHGGRFLRFSWICVRIWS